VTGISPFVPSQLQIHFQHDSWLVCLGLSQSPLYFHPFQRVLRQAFCWEQKRNDHLFVSPNVSSLLMSHLQVTAAKPETGWHLAQSCDDTLCPLCVALWYTRWGSKEKLW